MNTASHAGLICKENPEEVKVLLRLQHPDEVARVIRLLASDESRWVKGEDILVDGGVSAMKASSAYGLNGVVSAETRSITPIAKLVREFI